VVLLRVPDVAQALGTSVSTITRLEDDLVDAGLIIPRKRGRLGVRFTSNTINIATTVPTLAQEGETKTTNSAASPPAPAQDVLLKPTNIAEVTDFQTTAVPRPAAQNVLKASMYKHVPPD
jgi:hypothetical protein